MKFNQMKRYLLTAGLLLFVIALGAGTAHAESYTNGFGSAGGFQPAVCRSGYYEISNAGQLYWFAAQVNAGNVNMNARLTADITINTGSVSYSSSSSENTSYRKWTCIGSADYIYSGIFDGDGHTISGLYYYAADSASAKQFGAAGLFYGISGTVRDLTLTNSFFYRYNSASISALCMNNSGLIENCTVSDTWLLNGAARNKCGLVQTNKEGAVISGCTFSGRGVESGICGSNYGTIETCTNTAYISSDSGTDGGICSYNGGIVSGCTNTGSVYADQSTVGGICGSNAGTIQDCTNSGDISAYNYTVGGIVGSNNGLILRCSNTGDLHSTQKYLGGIAGQNNGDELGEVMIKDCFNTGWVESTAGYCGGIVGRNTAQIVGCYHAQGNLYLTSAAYTGTICGHNVVTTVYYNSVPVKLVGTIRNCLDLWYYSGYAVGGSDSGTVEQYIYSRYNLYGTNPAFFLNGSTSEGELSWYQNLDNGMTEDEYPVLDSTHGTVYRYQPSYSYAYSNYPPENHQHTRTKTVAATAPTCTADGKTESIQCLVCGVYLKTAQTVPAAGHTEGEWIIDVMPTQEQEGSRHTECSVCGETVRTESVTLEDLHTCTPVEVPGRAATCTENGVAACWQCSQCQAYYADSEGTLPLTAPQVIYAEGHTAGEWIVDRAPTQTQQGLRHANCTVCGELAKSGTLPVLSTAVAQGTFGFGLKWVLDENGVLTLESDYAMNDFAYAGAPWYPYRDQIRHVKLLGGMSSIGDYAFASCTKLETVCLNDEISIVGAHAFQNCSSLKSIYIFNYTHNVTIEDHAFYGCSALKTVSFPQNTTIGQSAFEGCSALDAIYINEIWQSEWAKPDLTVEETSFKGVTAVIYYAGGSRTGSGTLENCGGTVTMQHATYGTCGNDVTWSVDTQTGVLTLSGTGQPSEHFSGHYTPWTNLYESITSIVVEEGITVLPAYTFEYMDRAQTVSLPSTLEVMAFNAFNDCEKLNNLLIPANVTVTGGVPNRCNALTDVYYLGTAEEWAQVENGQYAVDNPYLVNEITLHLLTLHEDTPTCTEEGTQSYYDFAEPTVYTGLYDLDKKPIAVPGVLPATGHTEVIIPAVEATCTSTGWSEGKYCSVCEEELVTPTLVPQKEHVLTETREEPNCTQNGLLTTSCENCSYETRTPLPKLGHDHEAEVTDPTCTGQGYTTHTCSRCGDSYVDTYVEAAGHQNSDWSYVKEPGCTKKGSESRSCAVCGQTEEREVEPLGHSYEETVTPPSCVSKGYTTHTCSRCGDSYVDGYTDYTQHSMGEWVCSKPATCAVTGVESRFCTVCRHEEERELALLPHTEFETVFVWQEDLSGATVVRTCRCGHREEAVCAPEWTTASDGTLTGTVSAQFGAVTVTDKKEITVRRENDTLTILLPDVIPGLQVWVAAYDENGRMYGLVPAGIDGNRITLNLSGTGYRIFFLTEDFRPVIPAVEV